MTLVGAPITSDWLRRSTPIAPGGGDGHFIGACTGTESGGGQKAFAKKGSAGHGEVSGRSSAGAGRKGYSCRDIIACRDQCVPGARTYDRGTDRKSTRLN